MEKTKVYGQMIAFDKNSGATYSENLVAETKEQVNKQFKNFEENVPFTKWYYEIELDDIDLTDEQKEIVSDLDLY